LKATPVAFGLTGRASVAVLFFAFLAPFATAAETQPNIIFLLADDQCTYSMGCYGTPRVKTPHLDRLAKDGMVFDKHGESRQHYDGQVRVQSRLQL